MVVAPTPIDGRRARWEDHNLARRRVILEAATEVLADLEPGAEIHVRQIAEKAGLSRTVVYRHFADRADLDIAVQRHIFRLVAAELTPALSLEGTPIEIIRKIVGAYVGWTAANPSLHRFAERDPEGSAGPSPMDSAIEQVARSIEGLITSVVEVVPVALTEEERRALDPLVFGLVGFGFTAVRRWTSTAAKGASAETMIDFLSEAIWHAIAGLATGRGLTLDPDARIQDLLPAVLEDGSPSEEGPS